MTSSAPSPRANRTIASPRARRLLRERGLDAALLSGSGPRGRILAADVTAFQPPAPPASELAPLVAPVAAAPVALPQASVCQVRHEVEATRLLEAHAAYAKLALARKVEVTLADLLLQTAGAALRLSPSANRVWQDGAWQDGAAPDVALSLAGGLVVSSGAKRFNLVEIAQWRSSSPESGGVAALALYAPNERTLDEVAMTPRDGNSSALGCGRITPRAFVVDGELAVVPTLKLCLSYHADAFDADVATELMQLVVDFLHDPQLLSVL